MANLSPKGDEIPRNTQEGDDAIVEQILPAKKNVSAESNAAVKAQDSCPEKESEVSEENDNNGSNIEPITTINQGPKSVRRASIPLEPSRDEIRAVGAMMNLQGKTIEEVIQEGTLDEQMALLRTLFTGIHEEGREYEKTIANLTKETDMSKINNSKLKSQIEGVKGTIETLKEREKALEEKLASLEETLQKKEEQEYDENALQHRVKWLDKESNLLNQHSRLEEEMKINLQTELEAKKAEISFFLLELEIEKTESEELKALKEEETEMQKKIESCKETTKHLIDDTVKIKREDAKKAEKIESMASDQNEWIINTGNRITNLRESFVEMQATICDKVNDLTESISNLIDKLAGNHCKLTASIFYDRVRTVHKEEEPLEAPSGELVFIENSRILNSTAEENLQESNANIG